MLIKDFVYFSEKNDAYFLLEIESAIKGGKNLLCIVLILKALYICLITSEDNDVYSLVLIEYSLPEINCNVHTA